MLGSSIAVDGRRAAFGELNSEVVDRSTRGGVALFDLDAMTLLRKHRIPNLRPGIHDLFGASLDLDGNRLIAGAPGVAGDVGAAFVFDVESGAPIKKLTVDQLERSDYFGSERGTRRKHRGDCHLESRSRRLRS